MEHSGTRTTSSFLTTWRRLAASWADAMHLETSRFTAIPGAHEARLLLEHEQFITPRRVGPQWGYMFSAENSESSDSAEIVHYSVLARGRISQTRMVHEIVPKFR
jgi:hypothetical protein